MRPFELHILASDKPFYEGECVSLVIPTPTGQYGIQAYHSNLVTAVVPGELDFTYEKDGGLVRVRAAQGSTFPTSRASKNTMPRRRISPAR